MYHRLELTTDRRTDARLAPQTTSTHTDRDRDRDRGRGRGRDRDRDRDRGRDRDRDRDRSRDRTRDRDGDEVGDEQLDVRFGCASSQCSLHSNVNTDSRLRTLLFRVQTYGQIGLLVWYTSLHSVVPATLFKTTPRSVTVTSEPFRTWAENKQRSASYEIASTYTGSNIRP